MRHLVDRRGRAVRLALAAATLSVFATLGAGDAAAQQDLRVRFGTPVPVDVKNMYEGGVRYLTESQLPQGGWNGSHGNGPGIAALCLLALLATGENPNYGRHAEAVHKGFRFILRSQNAETGFIAQGQNHHGSMYEHSFATLALAEAYGALDDRVLWAGENRGAALDLGLALERAVGAILTSQDNNPLGGWRYQPQSTDADTSVTGAASVALLAARNAGLEVPDANIAKVIDYFQKATLADGSVCYTLGSGGGESTARTSISCLVFAIAKQKESEQHQLTLQYLKDRMDVPGGMGWPWYSRYYMAQALFQGDLEAWTKWNELNTEILQESVRDDGSIGGDPYSTSMSLLSMALNWRLLPIYER